MKGQRLLYCEYIDNYNGMLLYLSKYLNIFIYICIYFFIEFYFVSLLLFKIEMLFDILVIEYMII